MAQGSGTPRNLSKERGMPPKSPEALERGVHYLLDKVRGLEEAAAARASQFERAEDNSAIWRGEAERLQKQVDGLASRVEILEEGELKRLPVGEEPRYLNEPGLTATREKEKTRSGSAGQGRSPHR